MQKEEEKSSRRFLRFLSDYLLFCGVCLFFISTVNPFFASNYTVFIFPGPHPVVSNVTFWSYKESLPSEIYFNSYWFGKSNPLLTYHSAVSWMLVATFSLQILTILFALVSLVWMRKLRFISSISSAITIVLMIQIYADAHMPPDFTGRGIISNYELGYLFAWPSTFLFLFAVIMHLFSIEESH